MEVLDYYIAQIVRLIINPLIALTIAAAFCYGIWGAVQMVLNAGNEEALKKNKTALFWGIVGFVIMLTVGGIINVVVGTFGISSEQYGGTVR